MKKRLKNQLKNRLNKQMNKQMNERTPTNLSTNLPVHYTDPKYLAVSLEVRLHPVDHLHPADSVGVRSTSVPSSAKGVRMACRDLVPGRALFTTLLGLSRFTSPAATYAKTRLCAKQLSFVKVSVHGGSTVDHRPATHDGPPYR